MVIRCYVTYTGVYKFNGMLLSYDFGDLESDLIGKVPIFKTLNLNAPESKLDFGLNVCSRTLLCIESEY